MLIISLLLLIAIILSFSYLTYKVLKVANDNEIDMSGQNLCTLAISQNITYPISIPMVLIGLLSLPLIFTLLNEYIVFKEHPVFVVAAIVMSIGCISLGLSIFKNGSAYHSLPGYIMVCAYFVSTILLSIILSAESIAVAVFLFSIVFIDMIVLLYLLKKKNGVVDYIVQLILILFACVFFISVYCCVAFLSYYG